MQGVSLTASIQASTFLAEFASFVIKHPQALAHDDMVRGNGCLIQCSCGFIITILLVVMRNNVLLG